MVTRFEVEDDWSAGFTTSSSVGVTGTAHKGFQPVQPANSASSVSPTSSTMSAFQPLMTGSSNATGPASSSKTNKNVGIALGVLCPLLVVGLAFAIVFRRRRRIRLASNSHFPPPPVPFPNEALQDPKDEPPNAILNSPADDGTRLIVTASTKEAYMAHDHLEGSPGVHSSSTSLYSVPPPTIDSDPLNFPPPCPWAGGGGPGSRHQSSISVPSLPPRYSQEDAWWPT